MHIDKEIIKSMQNFLNRTISVRQIFRWARRCLYVMVLIYLFLWIQHDWNLKMGPTGHFNSPYRSLIPSECHRDALSFGDTRTPQTLREHIFLEPPTEVISLSKSEEKLGYGMRGIPCMGYNFLMVLHATNFKKVEKYVDDNGNLIGTITYEIVRPYRPPVSRDEMKKLKPWPELESEPKNDTGLVGIEKGSLK